jgi:signal transduction histidine kinase
MFDKIYQEKYLLILRYGYILFFISAFINNYRVLTSFQIVVLLLYIINNQLRYFIFPRKYSYAVPSLAAEFIICFNIFVYAGRFGALVFIPAMIDFAYMFKTEYSLIYIIGVIVSIIYKKRFDALMIWIIAALPVYLLIIRSKEVEVKKTSAQDLYDNLRENEEKLKVANKELEAYANTIEEIAVLRERNRISREIHDNVGHALSTIVIQLGAIEKMCIINKEEASAMAKNLAGFAKEGMESVRAAVKAMKPREFDEYEGVITISEMIKNFEKLTGVKVKLRVSDKVWKLNSDQTMVIYRIIQEFMSNSIRHGKATEVNVFINFMDTGLRVHLKDNGIGCSSIKPGNGLSGIKERVEVFGGDVEYYSKEGCGFELIVTMDKVKLSMDGV